MAPKRPAPAEVQPPPAESSDEEISSGEEEEEEEESSDSDQQKASQPKAPHAKPASAPPRPNKPQVSAPLSESESESEAESEPDEQNKKPLKASGSTPHANPKPQKSAPSSESESESESDSDVTPVAAKPLEGQNTSKKQNLKRPRNEPGAASEDAAKTPSKKTSKAASRSSQSTGEESSRTLFQRIWSEEDEITLLEGMVEYREKRGIDPSVNVNSLHEFVKEKLRFDAAPAQLTNKIRNLKKKFGNNQAKAAKNGKDRTFTKPNEQRVFDLSKKLWDSEEGLIKESPMPKAKANGSTLKKKKSAGNTPSAMAIPPSPQRSVKVKDENAAEKVDTINGGAVSRCEAELSRFSNGRVDDGFLRRGLDLINDSKREEWEEKWKKLNLAELEVMSRRALMVHEQATLILEAYKKSGE